MRTRILIAALIFAAAPALAAGTAGLTPQMWQQVRATEPSVLDLTPTPSPEAPATLSLKQSVGLAFAHNAGFRASQDRLVSARQALWVASQQLFLTLTANGQRSREPGEDPTTTFEAGVDALYQALRGGALTADLKTGTQDIISDLFLQQPAMILTFDQPLLRGFGAASPTYQRIRQARTDLFTAELSFYDARQDLAVLIIGDYLDVVLALGQVDIAQRSEAWAKAQYDINYAKFSGEGVKQPDEKWVTQVPELDVDQARLSWENAKQRVISEQQAYRDAMDRLLVDMGLRPGADPKLTTVVGYRPESYDEAALTQQAVQNSTLLAGLSLDRENTQAQQLVARNQLLPDLVASVGGSNLGETVAEPLGTGWFAALRVEVPFRDRRLQEDAASATRSLQVLDQQIISSRDRVIQELQRQVRAADSGQARITIGQQSVALAQKSRDQAQGMYDEGLSDYLRVQDAENRRIEQERSLLQDQIEYFLTTVRLQRALGRDVVQGLPE